MCTVLIWHRAVELEYHLAGVRLKYIPKFTLSNMSVDASAKENNNSKTSSSLKMFTMNVFSRHYISNIHVCTTKYNPNTGLQF